MTQVEVYKLFALHHNHVIAWHDKVLMEALESLHDIGYVEPRYNVLYYDYTEKVYGTTIIHLTRERMLEAKTAQQDYELMQQIDKKIQYPVIATMFIAEGTTTIEDSDEKLAFILFALETHIRGWKNLYRIQKQNLVNEDGSTTIKIENVWHDLEASKGHTSAMIEKYAHIIRPNWFDERAPHIYN